jgi:plasmid stability protein
MPNLSIKDVPDSWAEALRRRAARHPRSLQGELMALLEQAVSASGSENLTASQIVSFDSHGWPVVRLGSKSPDQVFGQMRDSGAMPVKGQPLAVDIVRHDRETN